MNGAVSGVPANITVTLLEDGWIAPPWERAIFQQNIDEEEREYLRHQAFIERATAQRLFMDDDI